MARALSFVVEDDPAIRKLLRKYLNKLGFDVSEAATSKAALAWLAQNKPDLVCLDLMLPESSGYTICEQIRSSPHLGNVPVLIVSARSTPADRALAEEAGATAYVIKPIRWGPFAEIVNQLMTPG